MGTCFSNESSIQNNLITDELKQQEIVINGNDDKGIVHNIVLLGASNSGKTSLLNQLNFNTLYPYGKIDARVKSAAIKDIIQNCIDDMLTLCEMIDDKDSIDILLELTEKNDTENIGTLLQELWNKPAIKVKYKYRHFHAKEYYLNDNMDYFFDNICSIMNDTEDFNLSIEDLMRHKSNTRSTRTISGNSWHSYQDMGKKYTCNITDIGSRIDNISKYIHHFNNVHATIFLIDLSTYCRASKDNHDTELLLQALNCDSGSFRPDGRDDKLVRVVLLSKNDIFEQCMRSTAGISFKECLPGYDGPAYETDIKWAMIASYEARRIGMQIGWFVLMDVVEIIEMYLKIERDGKYANMTDQQYFGECWRQSIQYIRETLEKLISDEYPEMSVQFDIMEAERVLGDIQFDIWRSWNRGW